MSQKLVKAETVVLLCWREFKFNSWWLKRMIEIPIIGLETISSSQPQEPMNYYNMTSPLFPGFATTSGSIWCLIVERKK
jgi:hypothetical protein